MPLIDTETTCSAVLSPDRVYRYELWRRWGDGTAKGYVVVIGLNPSTADETTDDPTIRRCIAFAKSWGYETLCMLNLFAFRATDPNQMLAALQPIGDENDATLRRIITSDNCMMAVAAWGAHGKHRGRDKVVFEMLYAKPDTSPMLSYLRRNSDGSPAHPLYLPKTLRPVPMETLDGSP